MGLGHECVEARSDPRGNEIWGSAGYACANAWYYTIDLIIINLKTLKIVPSKIDSQYADIKDVTKFVTDPVTPLKNKNP